MNPFERHMAANSNMRKKDIFLGNLLGGLAWGLGSVIGATIVVAILFGILRQLNFIPGVNEFLNQEKQALQGSNIAK